MFHQSPTQSSTQLKAVKHLLENTFYSINLDKTEETTIFFCLYYLFN